MNGIQYAQHKSLPLSDCQPNIIKLSASLPSLFRAALQPSKCLSRPVCLKLLPTKRLPSSTTTFKSMKFFSPIKETFSSVNSSSSCFVGSCLAKHEVQASLQYAFPFRIFTTDEETQYNSVSRDDHILIEFCSFQKEKCLGYMTHNLSKQFRHAATCKRPLLV